MYIPVFVGPNRLNFRASIGNPESRLERVWAYLALNGPKTKRDIFRDVFNKTLDDSREMRWKTGSDAFEARWKHQRNVGELPPNHKGRGWASGFFTCALKNGLLRKHRNGNTVTYSLPTF